MTYKEYIQNILNSRGRFSCGEEYHERHHIVPKCCGGSNDRDNLIDLFAREHFEVHKLLALENPDNKKLVYAWWCMCSLPGNYKKREDVTSEEYEEARICFSKTLSERVKGESCPFYGVHNFGEDHPFYGKHHSKESKDKISNAMQGENHPQYGTHHSDKTKEKMRLNHADFSGGNHPQSKKVIRLSDLTVYDYCGQAATENHIDRSDLSKYCKKHKYFMYYDEWLQEQNNLEK